MKILLVEDEPFMLEAISSVIEHTGWDVLVASNADEAKNLLKTEHVGLVITDLLLPEPEGVELVYYIKDTEATKNIPVIVVSGMDNTSFMGRPIPSDAWIEKPFTLDQLLGAIKRLTQVSV